MVRSLPGRQHLLDRCAVAHHAELVAGLPDHLCQHRRCRGRLVQLRHGQPMSVVALGLSLADKLGTIAAPQLKCRARKAPCVQHRPHLLATLRHELPRHHLAAPGRGGPAHRAQLVAGLVLAQRLKLTPTPAQALLAPLPFHLPRAHQEELIVTTGLLVRRVHAHTLRCGIRFTIDVYSGRRRAPALSKP